MTSYTFDYGPKVVGGLGASDDLAPHVPEGPLLFVTDANLRALGLVERPLASLRERHDVAVFYDVQEDPSEASVLAALDLAREVGAAGVVGFGGGSPMDVAKAVAYLHGSGDDIADIYGVGFAEGRGVPLLLIPTTAGTGSEATPISILTVGETEKKGIVSPALYADTALLDATLTTGLPRHVTAATGIDAMVHAIEAFTSRHRKNPMSDALAREALRLLAANIRAVCDTPDDLSARDAMLRGSYLAGVAFANAPVAGVHALAYPLGGHFHVPHGLSNALMLPQVLAHNMSEARDLYAELAVEVDPRLASLGTQARAQGLVEALRQIAADIGLSPKLVDVGVSAHDLDLLADEAMKQERLLVNNPVPITRADARRMYEAAL
ncbi:iron-containing alcohol dehydrogenase [Aurantiacibacter gangjinensis]|uniref:Alcohol dehydrogenase 2 n=1 Tax=Aurantiacibacter gangjinensis TaxID=502682 RepID=A0A0G9MPX9_9SPHN|nr:iron-containing alcohol dehydrogenase [Aurantiacibacter gangjinensis]APE28575.1 Alcohol dehydrogenase [Aurantiacibacter gangjinensis]KLE32765.1 alcohol dehydrogenase [Aurantiacibacter gangjinensis]